MRSMLLMEVNPEQENNTVEMMAFALGSQTCPCQSCNSFDLFNWKKRNIPFSRLLMVEGEQQAKAATHHV